jgi:WD40 repeat protein
MFTLPGLSGRVSNFGYSPDGQHLAVAAGDTVKVWDLVNGQEIRILKGHMDPVSSVSFSPDGTRLASASDDRTVKVGDADSGE